jgi:hypothetical protein
MKRLLPLASLALLPSLLAACGPAVRTAPRGAGSMFVEQTVFPTKDVVAKLAAAPTPAKLSDDHAKDVPAWDLTGPLPDAVDRAPVQDDSPWGKLMQEVAAPLGDAALLTEAMHCVARENALFYLVNDAMPAEMLERFIAARCGAPTGLAGSALQLITGDASIPDEKIYAQFQAKVRENAGKLLQGGRVEAGLAFVRKGGRAVIGISAVPQTVRLERTPLAVGPDGKVVLRGEVIGATAGVKGLINRGKHGYAECTAATTVALPRFVITCPVSRDDEVAWLSVSAYPPGRVLGSPVVDMMVWPSGAPGKTYAKLARGAAPASAASTDELLAEINRVRGEAKLSALRLAEQETRTATRLAPHFFGALEGGKDEGISDQVALGLLAGWEVEGMVRTGNFVSTWINDAASWAEVVRAAITRPIGRATLLDPTAERVALGPADAARGRGAVMSTYALFDAYKHDEDAKALAARIAAARGERGLLAPKLVIELNGDAERAAQSVQAGARAPLEALSDLLSRASERLGRSVRGWVAESSALDRIKLPDPLLTQPSLALGIGVAHHRPQGAAWGRFVVLIVMLDETPAARTARVERPSSL